MRQILIIRIFTNMYVFVCVCVGPLLVWLIDIHNIYTLAILIITFGKLLQEFRVKKSVTGGVVNHRPLSSF